jgi:DNA-binding NarL/FixJ family response regulator
MISEIKIFIADDYFLIREGIKKSLKSIKEIRVVGESNNLENFIPHLRSSRPDIVILEINLCDKPVKELVHELKIALPGIKVLVISDCSCELPVMLSIRAGISGFINKTVSRDELITAVKTIAGGGEFFTQAITRILMKSHGLSKDASNLISGREQEILQLICKGKSNEQIGETLFLSEKTVATHKRNIMKKAGVNKTGDLIIWAFQNNLSSAN